MRAAWLAVAIAASCGAPQGANTATEHPSGSGPTASSSAPVSSTASAPAPVVHESPPETGPRRDIHFPAIARSTLPNGLEVNIIEYHALPVLHLQLVARAAGASADPAQLPGLASFTGDMLKEGTRSQTSAQIADAIDFVGGTLAITTGPDSTTIAVSVLRDHAEEALTLLSEIVTDPVFPQTEIDNLKRREDDRLTQMAEDPGWVSRRAFYRATYGTHPYAETDTTPEALHRFTRSDVVNFHRTHYLAGSMFLAVVGDVHPSDINPLIGRLLGRIRRGRAPPVHFPTPPTRTAREIIVVDRPDSAQSVIRIGNLALRRASDEYVPLSVANQILGGDAASRLFMELREHRSLTYGAYSRVTGNVDVGTFQASGAVRTPVTAEALQAFFEQLDRDVREVPTDEELAAARAYLVDSFPLAISTPGDLATLLVDLRLYGLPDTYWDTYRSRIGDVTAQQALAAAQRYIHPDTSVVVIVGAASQFVAALRRYGNVHVVNINGEPVQVASSSSAPP